MYTRTEKWAFTFSLRDEDNHVAVVSYARMDPTLFGNERDDALTETRLFKMIAKDIGIICYGREVSQNPRSVLYGNILGTDELDVMTDEFDP
jgi:predicted Zn-dependent protease